MYALYTINNLNDLPINDRYVFVFCEEQNITKLSTNPNISMQLSYFDEGLPIVFVLTNPQLYSIYEHVIPPNCYLFLYEEKYYPDSNVFNHIYRWCIEKREIKFAMFAEWYTVLSKVEGTQIIPFNMNKNPNYEWEGDHIDYDFSAWFETFCATAKGQNLCSIGVNRRHRTDLLALSSPEMAEAIPYPPIQLFALNFDELRNLNAPLNTKIRTKNSFVRDSAFAVLIYSLGGEVDCVDSFTVSAPSVTYTEEDLSDILNLKKKWRKR